MTFSKPIIKANYRLLICSDQAEEAAYELSALSVTAKDTVCEFSYCSVAAARAILEFSKQPIMTEALNVLFPCPVNPFMAIGAGNKPFVMSPEATNIFSVCLHIASDSDFELYVSPLSVCKSDVEPFVCPLSSNVFEVPVSPIRISEPVIYPLSSVGTPETITKLSEG